MLFNSYIFIIAFLPITCLVYFLMGRKKSHDLSLVWLILASLFYYSWWNPVYLWIILGSVSFNFTAGTMLGGPKSKGFRFFLLCFCILCNLSLLGYYKYTAFIAENLNYVFNDHFQINKIALPLAISFFTFQQITYLVSSYKKDISDHSFIHYCVFVTFFPQLIAGPIVHHNEMLPQFTNRDNFKFKHRNLSIGLTLFFIGLFKKVIIADSIAMYTSPVFEAAEQSVQLGFFDAWAGALGYTFQLYFDFSGYSDMAIGCAKIFGIHLPVNFFSPYKARSVTEFWSRWHMTLSRFLQEYLYIPLGGNRKGRVRQLMNLMLTMLIGGLWHGASWTFVLWGGMHGLFLIINHLFRGIQRTRSKSGLYTQVIKDNFSITLTFLCVTCGWVLFRSDSFDSAIIMYRGMAGLHGFTLPPVNPESLGLLKELPFLLETYGVIFAPTPLLNSSFVVQLLVLLLVVRFLPNSQQIMGDYFPTPAKEHKYNNKSVLNWRPSPLHAILTALIALYTIASMTGVSEFLYYQF